MCPTSVVLGRASARQPKPVERFKPAQGRRMSPGLKKKIAEEKISEEQSLSKHPEYEKDSDDDIPLAALLELKSSVNHHEDKRHDDEEGSFDNAFNPDKAKGIVQEATVNCADKEELDASNPERDEGSEKQEDVGEDGSETELNDFNLEHDNGLESNEDIGEDGVKDDVDTSDTEWSLYLDGSEESTGDEMLLPELHPRDSPDSSESSSEESVQMRPKRLASSELQ